MPVCLMIAEPSWIASMLRSMAPWTCSLTTSASDAQDNHELTAETIQHANKRVHNSRFAQDNGLTVAAAARGPAERGKDAQSRVERSFPGRPRRRRFESLRRERDRMK